MITMNLLPKSNKRNNIVKILTISLNDVYQSKLSNDTSDNDNKKNNVCKNKVIYFK